MKCQPRILLLLLVAGVALLTAACSDGGGMVNSDEGRVRIVMSGGPEAGVAAMTSDGGDRDEHDDDCACRRLKAANVTFTSVLARNLDGVLVDTSMELPRTINMLRLAEGRVVELPAGFLPPGLYDQIVVVMKDVEFVLLNDTRIKITPPLGGWTSIIGVRPRPFEVIEGQTTTVRLKFFPHLSFKERGDDFEFEPEFDMDD
jgi:hypothetical protein